MSAKASGSNPTPNGDAKARSHHDGSSGRAFTVDQKTAVIRVRRCAPTAFYDILGLEEVKTTCSDNDIKKAYRKLSLLTHPDKNGYDGADEAFKMVSRAFQILSDADKKSKYDRFGGDPDNRFGNGSAPSASPFSAGFRSPGARGAGMWEEEISPEELFRQFFGGGMAGGPFGTSTHPFQSFFSTSSIFGEPPRNSGRSFERSLDRNFGRSFEQGFVPSYDPFGFFRQAFGPSFIPPHDPFGVFRQSAADSFVQPQSNFAFSFSFSSGSGSSFSFGTSSLPPQDSSSSRRTRRRTRGPDPYQFL